MAAPTVGAVMADILPYLGVKQTFSEEELPGRELVMQNLVGKTPDEAKKLLQKQGLEAVISGTGETVSAQIPAPGQSIPGRSQVLLYLEEAPEQVVVSVPDFLGMHRQQASDAALELGLYLLVRGNPEISPQVTVTAQSIAKETQVPAGTTIILEFTDTAARD